MRIVSVCRVYPTQRPGGMGFVCQDRARELVRQGHEVHVFTTGIKEHNRTGGVSYNDEGVIVHHTPCEPLVYSDKFAEECTSYCKTVKPNLIHMDSFDVNRPWWTTTGIKVACTLHGFCWGAWFTKINLAHRNLTSVPPLSFDEAESFHRERRLLTQTMNRVIGISLHEHWMLRHMMGLFDAKLVYNPIAPCFFDDPKPHRITLRPRYLFSSVSGQHERGLAIASEAALKAGVQLVVARHLVREQLPALIDSCDGLLLPTAYAQGLDLTVAEALARWRPVIATATGSYLREAEPGGLYHKAMSLTPLMDVDGEYMAEQLRHPERMPAVGPFVADVHRPENHVRSWLEAVQ